MNRRMWIVSAGAWVLASCRGSGPLARGVDDGTVRRYPLAGEVIRLNTQHRIATIKHGRIAQSPQDVWMEAMTMDFPVPESSDFERLKEGARIRATVCSRQSDYEYWIREVRLE